MNIHYLQHVSFEGLGSIESALKTKGHHLSNTPLYEDATLPLIKDIDWLIVMGGPMSIDEEAKYPWLRKEKEFIKDAIQKGKKVLGICLGAQLIADALGAKIVKNAFKEIGWFNIHRSAEAGNTLLSKAIPEHAEVFHWHGDTFDIPQGAIALASSEACKNQGFILDDRVVALQFHLETTLQSARLLIKHCRDDLDSSPFVQTESELLSNTRRFSAINKIMLSVLEALEGERG